MKDNKIKIGFIPGVWDLLHHGHLNVINAAKSYCDYLIVGVCCDQLVLESKGSLPAIKDIHRELLLQNLKAVDNTFIYHNFVYQEVVEAFGANVVIVGEEFGENEVQQNLLKYCEYHNIPVHIVPRTQGISTTNIKQTIKS